MTINAPSGLLAEGAAELLDRSIHDYAVALHSLDGFEEEHLEAVDYAVRHTVVRLLVRKATEEELAECYDSIKSLVPVEREEEWAHWHLRWSGIADVLDARLASLAARRPEEARRLAHADEILDLVAREPGLTQTGIADELKLKPANLSRILGVLEAHELIERRKEGREKRVHLGHSAAESPSAGIIGMRCTGTRCTGTLNSLLKRSVERWGARPFLIGDTDGVTYKEFAARVQGLARGLWNLKITAGDTVVAILRNEPEALILWFALARLGAVMVPINPTLPIATCESLLLACQPRGIVGRGQELERYGKVVEGLRIAVGDDAPPGTLRFDELARPSTVAFEDRAEPSVPCMVLQTSGTTKACKGVLLSQLSFTRPAEEFCRWMEVTRDDRFLGCLPLFHLAGQAFAVSAIAGGASLALVDHFRASRFWADVRRTEATLVRHLGEMLPVLCGRPPTVDDRRHTLRAVYGGGTSQEIEEEFERRFGVAVVSGYGLTETNTVLRNGLRDRRLGSFGREVPYCRVRVVDRLGRPTAPGQPGELQVERNPVMMLGYIGSGGEESFDNPWFRTGDLGYRDAEGRYYFVGRAQNIIHRRGEKIFPRQIEEVIRRHPAVAEVAVVGVSDRDRGEDIRAYVVLAEGETISPAALAEWCKDQLADFQIPRYWSLHGGLPRAETNKVDHLRFGEFDRGEASYDCDSVAPLDSSGYPAPVLPVQGLELERAFSVNSG